MKVIPYVIAVRIDLKNRRLLFSGLLEQADIQVCCHGEKLRWTCDSCVEWFEKLQQNDYKLPKF